MSPWTSENSLKPGKNKSMEEIKDTCKCAECAKREEEAREAEELNLAILIALVPALTITFLSNMGLF